MTLADLLKLLRRSILNDRTDRTSGSSDYLWEDDTLVIYINEAQRRFAVKGFVIRDATTDECCKIVLEAGKNTYPVHASVMSVMTIKRADQDADLARVGHSLFGAYRQPTERWIDPANWHNVQPGPTLAWSTDEALNDIDGDSFQQITLRVYPTPRAEEEGQVIRLRVVRKPIAPLVVSNLGATPEIPEDHHIEMLDWAAYLALRIVDDDAGNAKRAADFAGSFEAHVAAARKLAMMKMFAPTQWGFGRGGFTWGS